MSDGKGSDEPPSNSAGDGDSDVNAGGSDDGDFVWAKYFTTSDGRKVWADDYGYDAWPIPRR